MSRERLGSGADAVFWPRLRLAVVMVVAAAVLLWETRGQSLYADEWGLYVAWPVHWSERLFWPNNGSLIPVLVLLYTTVFQLAGPSSTALRVILIASELVCAGLLYELVRRRTDHWLALGSATLLLFLGSAWMVVVGTVGIPYPMTVSFGLGTLLALERKDLRGDVVTCVLLCLALATQSMAIAFVAGAAISIALRGRSQLWRRAWAVAIPLALYASWRLWALRMDTSVIALSSLYKAPFFISTCLAAGLAALTGLFRGPGTYELSFSHAWGWPLAVLYVSFLVYRVLFLRPRAGADLLIFGTITLVYWLGLSLVSTRVHGLGATLFGVAPMTLIPRNPDANYYQYLNATLLLLISAAALRGLALPRYVRIGLAVWFPLALIANLIALHAGAKLLRLNGEINRAELAATELVGEHGAEVLLETVATTPDFTLDLWMTPSQYLAGVRRNGSAAMTIASLASASQPARAAADQTLVRLLALAPEVVPRLPAETGLLAPSLESGNQSAVVARGSCLESTPVAGSPAEFSVRLPPGGFALAAAPGAPVQVKLRRFDDRFGPALAPIPGGSSAVVRIPPDAAEQPWAAWVSAQQQVTVCAADGSSATALPN